MTVDDVRKLLQRPTAPVPEVGRALGMSRNAAYEAVKEGRFPVPVVKTGRRKMAAVTAPLRPLLGISE